MVEFLVNEMGYTIFGLEASDAACNNINDYVLYGRGNAARALASQGFWVWDTNEVSEMIEWMRRYNQTVPENKKVRFFGFDVQVYHQGIDLVIDYLKKVAPEYVDKAQAAYKPFLPKFGQYNNKSSAEKEQMRQALLAVIGYLSFNEMRFVRATSQSEFEDALHYARNVLQYHETYGGKIYDKNFQVTGKEPTYLFNRDFYMAENIEHTFRNQPAGTRMVIWAHNDHIAFDKAAATPEMGAYLRKVFGNSYYAFGFSFNEGAFQSMEITKGKATVAEFNLGPAPVGSIDWYFARAGTANYIIDFQSAPKTGKVAEWLGLPLPMRDYGSMVSREDLETGYMFPTILGENWDAIIFIGKTSRARPNPKLPAASTKTSN
jgi:erythromycin esterase